MRSLVRTIHKVASGGGKNSVRMELRPLLSGFTLNVIMRMIAGKRYYGEDNAEAILKLLKKGCFLSLKTAIVKIPNHKR